MTTPAEAARDFVGGPQVVQAARLLLERFPLVTLCQALVVAQDDDADTLLACLERLAEFEEVRETFMTEEVATFLKQGVPAPDPRARRLVARLLLQIAKTGENGVCWLAATGLLTACEALLLDPETGTAEVAAKIMQSATQWPEGRRVLLGDGASVSGVVGQLQGQAGLPDTERFRVLHLVVELGRASEEAFSALDGQGAYKSVMGAFFTDDLLLKLNGVELMDALGSYPRGQALLGREGVPAKLAQELADPMCDSSVRMCVTRLLGFVVLRTPAASEVLLPGKDAPFPQAIAGLLDSRDPSDRLCALNAWANSAAHAAGLAFWLGWPEMVQQVLAQVAAPQNEVCKGALAAFAACLRERPPPAGGQEQKDAPPEVALWQFAEQSLLPVVLKNLVGKPFPDVRSHCWQLLAVLVRSRSAAQKVLPSEEIRDLLLDFTSETNSEARIAKHEFVESLVSHQGNWLAAFLDEKVEQVLVEFSRQGPHWVPRNSAVIVGDSGA